MCLNGRFSKIQSHILAIAISLPCNREYKCIYTVLTCMHSQQFMLARIAGKRL